MTNKEAIEILLDMANDLQIFPTSKQGHAIQIAITALKGKQITNEVAWKLLDSLAFYMSNDPATYMDDDTLIALNMGVEALKEKAKEEKANAEVDQLIKEIKDEYCS